MTTRSPACRPIALAVLLLGILLALAGCRSGGARSDPGPDMVDAGEGNRPWYAGTPEVQAQIRRMVALAPETSGAARIELGRRIVSFGEPAVPILVDSLSDPNPDMRGQAAWLLGFMKDPRTANALARAASDDDRLVRYEASSALLQIGDPRGLPGVILGLADQDPRVREKCIAVLEAHTGETMGYQADGRPEERAAAIRRWRAWAASRGGSL